MKLIFLRHASRDPHPLHESGLNRVGQQQAADLAAWFSQPANELKPTLLLSSPRKRAQETLKPSAAKLLLEVETRVELDERQDQETGTQFTKRVQTAIENIRLFAQANDVVVICTHFDWLETAMSLMPDSDHDAEILSGFATCEKRVFEWRDGEWVYVR